MFANIKPGNDVVIRQRQERIATVERVTRTRFSAGGFEFRKKDGKVVGDARDRYFPPMVLRIATSDDFAERDRATLQRETATALSIAERRAWDDRWPADYSKRVLALLKEMP